jgi:hypothetical protein
VKRMMRRAAATIAIGLIITAAHAQSGNLKLPFHVPSPFTVENTTFAAGEYEVTESAPLILELRNLQDQAAPFEQVEFTHSRTEADAQVTVSVYNDAQVPSDTLTPAEQQAARIFSRAGFDVTWLNCTHVNSGRGARACNEIDVPGHLALRIIAPFASSTSDAAFGVAFLAPDGTGRYSDVFWKRAQELHANSNVDLAGILGSVIAHEMGHLLLGSNAHAISGIMRAHWESDELHRIAMGTLMFLPEQSKRMRVRIGTSKALLVFREPGLNCSFRQTCQPSAARPQVTWEIWLTYQGSTTRFWMSRRQRAPSP